MNIFFSSLKTEKLDLINWRLVCLIKIRVTLDDGRMLVLDLRDRGDTWFIPYETIWSRKKQRPHPSSFPPKLPMMCIMLHGLEKTKLVLDPFMGIGNTAVACMRLGVDYIGFEMDKSYAECAEQQIKTELSKTGKS